MGVNVSSPANTTASCEPTAKSEAKEAKEQSSAQKTALVKVAPQPKIFSFSLAGDMRSELLHSWTMLKSRDVFENSFTEAVKDSKGFTEKLNAAITHNARKRTRVSCVDDHAKQYSDFWDSMIRHIFYHQDTAAKKLIDSTAKAHANMHKIFSWDQHYFDLVKKSILGNLHYQFPGGSVKRATAAKIWSQILDAVHDQLRHSYESRLRPKSAT